MQIGISGPRGRQAPACKYKLWGQELKSQGYTTPNGLKNPFLASYLKNYPINFNETWQAHMTRWMLTVSQQLGCMRLKIRYGSLPEASLSTQFSWFVFLVANTGNEFYSANIFNMQNSLYGHANNLLLHPIKYDKSVAVDM